MKHSALIALGCEDRLADLLGGWAGERAIAFHAVQQDKACLNLVRKNLAAAVVLRIGRDLDKELSLIERLGDWFPETPVFVSLDADQPELAALCWDLGARYVLAPPQPLEKLLGILEGFLGAGPSSTRASP
jgi:hypothetical protein